MSTKSRSSIGTQASNSIRVVPFYTLCYCYHYFSAETFWLSSQSVRLSASLSVCLSACLLEGNSLRQPSSTTYTTATESA